MKCIVQQNIQLQNYNSFKTAAVAKLFCEPRSIDELKDCLAQYSKERKLVIGDGCNLFFTKDFNGLIIKLNIKGIKEVITHDSDLTHVYIEAMASENWDEFVSHTVNKKYSGLENLSYIPGTIGAAPVQNIGAYGAEVKDTIHTVTAINKDTAELKVFTNGECQFDYRNSIFKNKEQYIIVSVVFKLNKTFTYKPKYVDLNTALEKLDDITLDDVREAVIAIRKRKLPDEKIIPNCGSFYKNPYLDADTAIKLKDYYPDCPLYKMNNGTYKASAAYLIDKAGFKGKQIGNIACYKNQPLIIVNYGTSDGKEIIQFSDQVCQKVYEQFKIRLEPEVKII